jgi:hypothetical protein
MAPVLAIVRLVAAASKRGGFDPVGESVDCIATGPRRAILIKKGHGCGEQSDNRIETNEKADAQTTKRSGTEDLV